MTTPRTRKRVTRALWLGAGLGLVWGALAVVGTASADDGGLLGAVGRTAGSLVDTASSTVGAVADTASSTADAVGQTIAPSNPAASTSAHNPPPAPASGPRPADAAAIPATVSAVTDAVETAVGGRLPDIGDAGHTALDGTLDTVGTTLEGVGGIAASSPLGSLTDPVLDIVDGIPVVGGVASGLGVDDAAVSLIDTADGLLGDVGDVVTEVGGSLSGGSGDGVLPGLPGLPSVTGPASGPGRTVAHGTSDALGPPLANPAPPPPPPGVLAATSPARSFASADAARAAGGDSTSPLRDGPPLPPAPATPGASGGPTGAAAGGHAAPCAVTFETRLPPAASGLAGRPGDDALPSVPVYETDTSPD